ncbi:MAG: rhomboid family intramembrane serine protease [Spirochaetia bacterium]
MFIPIGDEQTLERKRAYVTYLLLGINLVVFFFLQRFGRNLEFTFAYGMIPEEIISGTDLTAISLGGREFSIPATPFPVYLTLLTTLFLHGGLFHLLGNMLYLWVFGDNIEHAFGHLRFLLFYLTAGAASLIVQIIVLVAAGGPLETITIGASGAVSAILGAYIVLFPRRRVVVLFIWLPLSFPAYGAIGIWIVFQVLRGLVTTGGAVGGVAYSAHIGGFILGVITALIFRRLGKKTG